MQQFDKLTLLSDAQALTASAKSADHFNGLEDRNLGIGEPMVMVVRVDVAADFTAANETYQFDIETDDNDSFSSPTVLASRTILATSLVAGAVFAIPIPPDTEGDQYYEANYVLGGTTPSITVTTGLVAQSMVPADAKYPSGYVVGS